MFGFSFQTRFGGASTPTDLQLWRRGCSKIL